jgi:hypothetical protein
MGAGPRGTRTAGRRPVSAAQALCTPTIPDQCPRRESATTVSVGGVVSSPGAAISLMLQLMLQFGSGCQVAMRAPRIQSSSGAHSSSSSSPASPIDIRRTLRSHSYVCSGRCAGLCARSRARCVHFRHCACRCTCAHHHTLSRRSCLGGDSSPLSTAAAARGLLVRRYVPRAP